MTGLYHRAEFTAGVVRIIRGKAIVVKALKKVAKQENVKVFMSVVLKRKD